MAYEICQNNVLTPYHQNKHSQALFTTEGMRFLRQKGMFVFGLNIFRRARQRYFALLDYDEGHPRFIASLRDNVLICYSYIS